MNQKDVEAALREAEAVVQRLDALRVEAEGMLNNLRRAAEEQAMQAVADVVAPERQAEAKAVAARVVRILDEVGAWTVARSPLGLAQRLLPEVREGLRELQLLVAERPAGKDATTVTVTTAPRKSGSGSTPAWHAP